MMTRFYFDRLFDGKVAVQYFDLSDPDQATPYQSLLKEAEEHNLEFPLVAVDGRVRLAGGAEYYQIKPLVEEALAKEPQPVE
jgi:hypothetical protein